MAASGRILEVDINFLGRRIFVEPSAAGKALPFSYKHRSFTVQLPYIIKADDGEFESTYDRTSVARHWLKNRDELDLMYGQPSTETITGKLMCFHINRFIVRSEQPIEQNDAKELAKGLLEWRDMFVAWLEAAQFSNLEYADHGFENEEKFDAFLISADPQIQDLQITEFPGEVYHLPYGHLIHDVQWLQDAITRASRNRLPPLHRTQLVSALKHYDREEYRECLLDAATAIEVTLTELLSQALDNLTNKQKLLVTEKYRGVNQLQAALKKLGISTPQELQSKIGTPRNFAMHSGKAINQEVAKNALDTAKDFIFKQMPLGD